jgi:predicted nucleic acid-binding protein
MNVLVDTSVWSLMLGRRSSPATGAAKELELLIRDGRAELIGSVRQELLSGLKGAARFENLRQHLRAFPDVRLETEDYELAAEFCNRCRSRGVQGSTLDFLICAAAVRRQFSIFTTDDDFHSFARIIPIQLHAPGP